MFGPDEDKPQLLGDLGLRHQVGGQGLCRRVDQFRQGGKHGFHHQVGHDRQGCRIQVLPFGHLGQVRGQVRADAFAQGGQGLAHRQGAAVLLAGKK
ncbi:hypothetical protein D9M73_252590 [compost metagenome]